MVSAAVSCDWPVVATAADSDGSASYRPAVATASGGTEVTAPADAPLHPLEHNMKHLGQPRLGGLAHRMGLAVR